MYFPFGAAPSPAEVGLPQAEAFEVPTPDGINLGAWFVPAQGTPKATIIVFNGNAGHRGFRASLARQLAQARYSVVLFDYRGYGGNGGAPSESGLLTDARSVRAYALSRTDVNAARLVYFGESLGTGVAVALAEEHPPRALVLRSPFTSMAAIASYHYPFLPVRWLLRDRYDSIGRVRRLSSPTLFIAGDQDRIVPFTETRALHAAAREPKSLFVIAGADHNDASLNDGAEMIAAVAQVLDDALSRAP